MSTQRNPKDSMKSTWRLQDRRQWSVFHWFYELLDIHPVDLHQDVPVHPKEEKVPYLPEWHLHIWVLAHAFLPILAQHLFTLYTGRNMGPLLAYALYTFAFKAIAVHELHCLRRMGHIHGFLDGDKHPRDGVPDVGVGKVVHSLVSTAFTRPVFTIFLSYRASLPPASMNWKLLPVEAGLYGIVLDFWYYWYHRAMHEVEWLWRFHRTHHLTKHPNPLLTLYADGVQELFDIAGIPVMTYFTLKLMGFPMGFYEWWIAHQYIVFAELAGHSGTRVMTSPPNTLSWFLRLFDGNLIIEDHDMHHRKGWKSSYNYGKQTRLWDVVFGTTGPRPECYSENIDYENTAAMPLL